MKLLNEATLDDILAELGNRFSDLVLAGVCKFDFCDDCRSGDAFFYVDGSQTQRRGLISILEEYNIDHEDAFMIDIETEEENDEDNLAFGL